MGGADIAQHHTYLAILGVWLVIKMMHRAPLNVRQVPSDWKSPTILTQYITNDKALELHSGSILICLHSEVMAVVAAHAEYLGSSKVPALFAL